MELNSAKAFPFTPNLTCALSGIRDPKCLFPGVAESKRSSMSGDPLCDVIARNHGYLDQNCRDDCLDGNADASDVDLLRALQSGHPRTADLPRFSRAQFFRSISLLAGVAGTAPP